MKINIGPAALLSLLLLSACGGGGSSSSIPTIPSATAVPGATATPGTDGTASPSPAATSTASASHASVVVTVPKRGAASGSSLVPLSTIVVQLNSLNGGTTIPSGTAPTTSYTVPTGQTCVAPAGCSFSINAPAGTLNITATAYAGTSPVATLTQTVSSTGNSGQSYNFVLGGIVKNLNFSSLPNLITGQATQIPLGFTMSDPSGALLLDSPFANPITLSDTDTSSSSGLEIAGSGTGPQANVTLNTPSSSVLFDYNGGTLNLPSTGGQTPLFSYSTSTYSIAPL